MRYLTRITFGALALVLVGCSANATAPGLVKKERKANEGELRQWACPTETGMVIRTGVDSAATCNG